MSEDFDYSALPANRKVAVARPMPEKALQKTTASPPPNRGVINTFAEYQNQLIVLLTDSTIGHLRVYDPDLQTWCSPAVSEALQAFFLRSRHHQMHAILWDDRPLRQDGAILFNIFHTFAHNTRFSILQRYREQNEDAFVIAGKTSLIWRPQNHRIEGHFYRHEHMAVVPYEERFAQLQESSEIIGLNTLGL